MNNIFENVNGIKIEVSPKIQLFSILMILSDEKEKDQFKRLFNFHDGNNAYFKEIENSFAYLKNSNLINDFNYLKDKYNFHYQNAFEYALCLDDNFEFKSYTNNIFINEETKQFNKSLKEFYYSKKFIQFYNEHIDEYKDWIESIKKDYEKYDVITHLEKYCGNIVSSKKYYIDFIPCETGGGYSIYLDDEVHYCFRVKSSCKDNHYFYKEDSKQNIPICVHEFLHGIINPLTIKYNLFNFESHYFNGGISFLGYGNDFAMFNEYTVRALTIRIISIMFDKKYEKDLIDEEVNIGFIYMENLVKLLKVYEEHRNKYITIDDFIKNINDFIINNLSN